MIPCVEVNHTVNICLRYSVFVTQSFLSDSSGGIASTDLKNFYFGEFVPSTAFPMRNCAVIYLIFVIFLVSVVA